MWVGRLFWKKRATVSDEISVRQKADCPHSYRSLWLCNSVPGKEPKEQGNLGLATSQCVDDVDVEVEYEPTEQLLSVWTV